jgi:ribonuclease D
MAAPNVITTDSELELYCGRLAGFPTIAFDTEFVSEHSYKPQLCLVQVAAGGELRLIDPLAVSSMTPFWNVLTVADAEIVVHAGREEMVFCQEATGRQPARLFDVQLAAGLNGQDYPSGYGNLISRLLGATPQKGETRTDWRRRPLSRHQLEYALDDVRHLEPLRDTLHARLVGLGRREWLASEMSAWQASLAESLATERWWKVSGCAGLSSRCQAIVRELWRWREGEAARRNIPARRVLRDDLIVELARRGTADPKLIPAVRGFERGDYRRAVPDLARAIQRALDLPSDQWPPTGRRENFLPQLGIVSQFVSAALNAICRATDVAPSLVATTDDIREFIAWRLAGAEGGGRALPSLAQGWRGQLIGQVLADLLEGKAAIRIRDPAAEQPLAVDYVASGTQLQREK